MRRLSASSFVAPKIPLVVLCLLAAPLLGACSGTEKEEPTPAGCALANASFPAGDPAGHSDPFGAKAVGQARAGRLSSLEGVAQPAHGRQHIDAGDFVLANDKIAVFIEDKGPSDGYARFGGEILGIDKIGDDGKPMGLSRYVETLFGLSIEMINPTSVSVLKDGSDGGEAVVRVAGKLEGIPFMQGPLASLFPRTYGLQAAYDFVLRPGEERLTMRMGIINPGEEEANFGVGRLASDELFGFFQYNASQLVTPTTGFGEPSGKVDWVGFDGGPWNFALRVPEEQLTFGVTMSGFALFYGGGFIADACSESMVDRAEIIAGGPDYDGLREAVRRVSGEAPWREVTGILTDDGGGKAAEAYVHVLDAKGEYLSRARTAADGTFKVHVPPGVPVTLVPQPKRLPPEPGFAIGPDETTAEIALDPHGTLSVVAQDEATGVALPVRVQVIPEAPFEGTPEAFGVPDQVNGRLYQEFAMAGTAKLAVPPGNHRVIVSRGYEWELSDQVVSVAAGQTLEVPVKLLRSVDSTNYMCADFHIHSALSADSNDPVEFKVRGAIADGLDIPVSSEHEWVADFQPVIQKLGLTKWAFGMASEELTTFTWGHFGVVPMTPDAKKPNMGAVDWIGRDPAAVFGLVRALPDNPVLIVNHPRGGGFQAYFDAAEYNRAAGKGRDGFWSDDFDAIEVFNDSDFEKNRDEAVADWVSMLNAGMKMWAVGSSDSHHLRGSPVGYPRTCLYTGHDDPEKLDKTVVRDAVATGATTISGGLFMTVAGPNGEMPGETVKAAADGTVTFTITVQAPSFMGADALETIVNGQSLGMEPLMPLGGGPGKKFVNQVKVPLDGASPRNWVVFHARGESDLAPLHPGRKPFAVSNPFFLEKN